MPKPVEIEPYDDRYAAMRGGGNRVTRAAEMPVPQSTYASRAWRFATENACVA